MPNRQVRARQRQSVADANARDDWLDRELGDCAFNDERLGKRFRSLLQQLSSSPGGSIPLVCQDWANTKAAYRFLSNDRVSEADILAGHFQSTRDRTVATGGSVLVLHDTTEFTYQRENTEAIGITKSINSGWDKAGRLRSHTVCGILMHSSLAVTTEGLPLGLAAVKFWTGRQADGHALASVALDLSVQRLMLAELLEQDHRQKARSRPTPGDHMERGRRLADLFTVPAGELLPHRFDHLPRPRDRLQGFGHVFAQLA